MNQEKLNKLKRNIKHYTPELIVAGLVVAAGVAAVCMYKKPSQTPADLVLPDWYFDRINETGEALLVSHSEKGDFLIQKLPQN